MGCSLDGIAKGLVGVICQGCPLHGGAFVGFGRVDETVRVDLALDGTPGRVQHLSVQIKLFRQVEERKVVLHILGA